MTIFHLACKYINRKSLVNIHNLIRPVSDNFPTTHIGGTMVILSITQYFMNIRNIAYTLATFIQPALHQGEKDLVVYSEP